MILQIIPEPGIPRKHECPAGGSIARYDWNIHAGEHAHRQYNDPVQLRISGSVCFFREML